MSSPITGDPVSDYRLACAGRRSDMARMHTHTRQFQQALATCAWRVLVVLAAGVVLNVARFERVFEFFIFGYL